MKRSDGLFIESIKKLANDFPEIQVDEMALDVLSLKVAFHEI